MHTCKLPMKTSERLEQINRNFFWGDSDLKRSTHTVAWNQVCKAKAKGGLRLKTVQETNVVLLAKLAWRYLSQPQLLWVKMFRCKYGDPDSWHDNHRKKPSSVPWRGLLHGYQLLKKGLRWNAAGSSRATPWWEPSTNGRFTTKSAYDLHADDHEVPDHFRWERIWKFAGPQRASLTLWQVAHNRLKTKALLWSRQILSSPVCDLCSSPWESTLHSVRDCIIARRIWRLVLPPPLLERFMSPTNPQDWIRANVSGPLLAETGYRHWPYIFWQLVHDIWSSRNLCLFQYHHRIPVGLANWIVTHSLRSVINTLRYCTNRP